MREAPLIPEEAVQAAAEALAVQCDDPAEYWRTEARAALEAAAPVLAAQARREVAEEIAQAITNRRCDQGSTFCKDCMCRREDGALARQIGEAR